MVKTYLLLILLPTLSCFPCYCTTLLSNAQEKVELVLSWLMKSACPPCSLEKLQAAQTTAACAVHVVCRVHVPPSSPSRLPHFFLCFALSFFFSLGQKEYRKGVFSPEGYEDIEIGGFLERKEQFLSLALRSTVCAVTRTRKEYDM